HDETALIEARALHGERHRRLEARDDVVAEVADDRLPERLGLVEADEPRAATDERVPPEAPTLHRLEEKHRRGALPQAEVGPERSEEVGGDLAGHGMEKAPCGAWDRAEWASVR